MATMVVGYLLLFALVVKSPHQVAAQPSFNGDTPGCSGNRCHTLKSGVITAQYFGNNTIRITLTGATGSVGGEVVDANGVVVVTDISTSSNPFDLTVTQPGVYKINGGYKSPKREWDSTTVRKLMLLE